MSSPLLVSTEELARHPAWRVFDCRHDLFRPNLGEEQYSKAHIPGALFAHLERDLSGPKRGDNGRHPLPEPRDFAAWLGRMGLKPQDRVVCYDANNGTMAARLWWMLRWIGHEEEVSLLDGGLAQWAADERPATAEVPTFAPSDYPSRPRDELLVDAGFIVQRLGSNSMLLLDARAQARYRGEQEPIDPVAGRIPGALNRFVADNLQPEGCFKSATTLRGELGRLLGDRAPEEIIHYCGSGVAACHNVFAMELAGFPGSRLYPGSWSEWLADSRRPRQKG